jgi:hypothetical protein
MPNIAAQDVALYRPCPFNRPWAILWAHPTRKGDFSRTLRESPLLVTGPRRTSWRLRGLRDLVRSRVFSPLLYQLSYLAARLRNVVR